MFKRLSVIAAVFFLLTASLMNPALAGKLYDEKIAIDDALQNYSGYYQNKYNFNGDPIHYITDTSLSKIPDANGYGCGFLTYGQPHGDYKAGQYRYIGYTFYGEDYTNMDFPPDKYANGADFASQNWVSYPWDDPAVKASNPNIKKFDPVGLPGDGDSDIGYRYVLQYSILFTDYLGNNGYKVDLSSNPSFWDNIHLYVHVLSPATTYSWGIGRMWHYDANGNLWYVTVPIAPGILIPPAGNLKAVSIDLGVPPGQKAEPGTEYTATVVFENESDQVYLGTPVAVLHGEYQATLYDENGQALPKKTISGKEVQVADFGKKGEPNAKRTFTCKWHPFAQARDGLTGIINRDEIGKVHLETTYEDNIVRAEIPVKLANLKVTDITLDPNPGTPSQLTNGIITVQNESEESFTATNTVWRVRHSDGTVLDENTITTDLAAGESKQLPFSFTPDIGDTYSVAAMINPMHDNPPNEVNWLSGDWPGDNRMEVSYYAEEPCTDISVTAGIYPLSVQSGGSVTVTAFVERADDGPDRAVPVSVSISSPYGGDKTGTLYLDRGGRGTLKATYTLGGEGDVVFAVEAWPDGTEDCRPGNNRDSVSAYVEVPFDVEINDSGIIVRLIS